jgi:hypothetical protein
MKVVVVSTPRTCSSYLVNLYAKKFDLIDYSEFFSDVWIKTDPQTKLKMLIRGDNYAIKFTSTSLLNHQHLFNLETFPWNIFDHIIVTERLDVAYQAASWLLLSNAQLNGYSDQRDFVKYLQNFIDNPRQFGPVPIDHLRDILNTIDYFHDKVKPYLLNSGMKSVKLVNHEMFQKNPEEFIEEFREKTGVDWVLEDMSIVGGNHAPFDYTPYIEEFNLRQIIQEIRDKNATKEENIEPTTTEQPVENEGTV